MPARKAPTTAFAPNGNGDVSIVSNATNATSASPAQHAHPKQSRQSGGGAGKQDDGVGIDDLLLPRSLISRLSRGVLPPNTSIQKDALLALTRSATVFVSYLSSHANEQSQLRHRKTLGVQDVYAALREIEFAGMTQLGAVGADGRTGGRLEREVEMFEELAAKKRKGYRDKVKARENGGAAGGGGAGEEGEDGGEPSSKKARRSSKAEEADDDDEEERMLEQQLNGTAVGADSQDANGMQTTLPDGISVVVPTRERKGKEKASSTPDQEDDDDDDDEGDDEGDEAEEVEDDPAGDDEDEDEEDEDEDDDNDNDDAEGDDNDDDDETQNTDLDDSRRVNQERRGLLPNGEVDIGSDEESD